MNAAICVTKRTSCKQNWREQILSHSSNTPVPPGISLSSLFSSVSSTVLLWASDLWLPAFFLWARLSVSSPRLYQCRLSPFPLFVSSHPEWPCLNTLFRPNVFFVLFFKCHFHSLLKRFWSLFYRGPINNSEIFSSAWHLLNCSTNLGFFCLFLVCGFVQNFTDKCLYWPI